MNLRDLRYLVAVADHRHFGRAAEATFVGQPTLSMQIKKLERELGVELIERNPRHVLLTPAGEEVVARARAVLAEVDGIHAIARRAQDPESGSIRLGVFPTLAPYLLPHVVPRLHDRFPKLELLLVEEKTHVVLQRLRDGQLDAGILALPVDAARPARRAAVPRGLPARREPAATRSHGDRRRPVDAARSRPSTCCCSTRVTACASRRCRCAGSAARPSAQGSARRASRRCVRWSQPASV